MVPLDRTVVILQPGYLPWLGFFDQMRRADVFVYYDDVQYDTHGWRNRNRIKTQHGPMWLTVPVHHHGLRARRILDVEIDGRTPWARKHLAGIRQAYARAPFLAEFYPRLEAVLVRPWQRLAELNLAVAALIAEALGVAPLIARSSTLDIGGERSERLVAICRHFGATRYVSGSSARSYLDVGRFDAAGIAVEWQDYAHPTYPQQHGAFAPYLSALDLLLNCGPASRDILAGGRGAATINVEHPQ
ncbi:MAG: WbqC family protein [Vicinamibacterales bacterium]